MTTTKWQGGFRSWALLTAMIAATGLTSAALRAEDARPVENDNNFGKQKASANTLPTVFFVGDSTLNTGTPKDAPKPLRGWAQEITPFFDTSKVNVVNRAIGGRSSRTYIHEGKWDAVLKEVKPGDIVIIQFGHNDVGRYNDPAAKGRPSLHSEGDETVEVTNANGEKETVHSFGWYMRKYCTDAKAKGATVILCSMVPHKVWKDGKIFESNRDTFIKWTKDAADKTGVLYVDLNQILADEYTVLGQPKVEDFFADKGTHASFEGAKFNATAVIAGLKTLPNDPLANDFSAAGKAVPAATVATTQSASAVP